MSEIEIEIKTKETSETEKGTADKKAEETKAETIATTEIIATDEAPKKRGRKPKNSTVPETHDKSNTDKNDKNKVTKNSIIKVCPVCKKEFEYNPIVHKFMVGKEGQYVCSWACFTEHCKSRMNDPDYISWRDKYFKKPAAKKGKIQEEKED